MDKQLLKKCIGAILVAAVEEKWNYILDTSLNDVCEMLEDSEVTTPEQAVIKFRDLQQYALESAVEGAECAAGWDPNP